MAAVVSAPDSVSAVQQPAPVAVHPGDGAPDGDGAPVNFVYLHVHNAIREELLGLEAGVKELLSETDEAALLGKLAALKKRYTFLERIYKYHSSVEDEVNARLRWSTPLAHRTSMPTPMQTNTNLLGIGACQ